MKRIKLLFFSVFVLLFGSADIKAQGNTCPGTPFCTAVGTPYSYANVHNGSVGTGATTWGCLFNEPDPSWFYIKTSAAGTMTYSITQGTTVGANNLDVDFIAYGPYSNAQFPNACNNLTGSCTGDHSCTGNVEDCSYSAASSESMTLVSPGAGFYYIIMITNFTGVTSPPGTAGFITFTQTGGPGSDCSITCPPTTINLHAQTITNYNLSNAIYMANGATAQCSAPFFVWPNEPAFTDPTTDILTPCLMADFNTFNTNENTNGSMVEYEGGSPLYNLCNGCPQGTIGGAVGTTGTELYEYLGQQDTTQAHPFVFCNTGTVGTTTVTIKNCWDGTVYAGPVVWNTTAASCFTLTIPATVSCGSAVYSITPVGGGVGVYDYHDGYAYVDPSVMPAGTYTLTYTFHGRNGCAAGIGHYTFTVPAKPVVTITPSATTICAGSSTSLTGGGANTYTWNTGSTSNPLSVSPGSTTIYTVTGTNTVTACKNTATATVTVNPLPVLTITPSPATLCSGSSSILTASGGTTYAWSANAGSATTSTVSVTPPTGATVYTVTGTTSGCSSAKTVTLTVTATPTVNITGTLSICSGSSTTLTGATASTYSWSVGSTSAAISVNPSSTTTYTLVGSNGTCSTTAVATVTVTPTPTLAISGTTALCSGQSTVLTGATATNYNWSTGATTNTISVSPPTGTTNYTLTGTNGACATTKTVSVVVTATPTLSISGTTALCSGQSTTLTGATATNYNWSTGATTNTISVTPPLGSTTYTLTGANGVCTNSTTVTTNVTATPTLSITGTTALCNGQSTTLTGATAIGYTWSTGATTNTISVTPPTGTTTYTLSGSNGGACTATKTVSVVVTATPTLSVSGTTALCSGQSTTLTGATAANYTWSTGATTNTISVSPPLGSTTYTLTGANGACTSSTTVTTSVTATPTLSISGTTALCSGQSTTLTGATATNYTWSTGATTNTISVTPPTGTANYTLTGSNGGGCTATKTVSVVVTATPTLSVSGTTALCSGQSTTLTGATAANYTWSTGATTNTISASPPLGSTTYTLTGANGACTSSATVTTSVTATPTLSISGTTALCSGQSTTLTGATATNYTWSTGATTNTISVTPPTGTANYTLTGSNGGGCTATKTVSIVVTATPTLSISGITNICSGNSTVLTGATASSYSWSTGATVNAITVTPGLGATTYTLTGNNNVCSASAVVTVSVTATPTVIISGNANICSGQSEILTAATATNFTWSPGGANTSSISVNPNATTTYTLTGANGTCTATTTASLSVTPTPTVNISGSAAICNGQSLVLTGATANSYSWSSGGITSNTITVNPTSTTIYTLTGTNGTCTTSAVATVTVNPLPVITGSVVTSAPCGQLTGCITSVSVNNGTPTYQYSWNGGTTWSNSSNYCNIAAGTYPLQVHDANGCTTSANISVPSQSGPSAPTAAVSAPAACLGDSAIFTVNPTTLNTTYTWNDLTGGGTHIGPSYTVTNINPSGTYIVSVTATDISGCISSPTTLTVTVNQIPPTSVSGTNHFCKGTNTVLSASPNSAGYSYQWSMNGTTIGGATSNSYTANAAGNYNVVITNSSTGCKANLSANYTVTVDSLPKIDTTSMVVTNSSCTSSTGSVLSVTVNPSAGNAYSWTNSSGTVVGTSLNLNNVPAGNYCLLVTTNPTSCKDNICGITINNAGAPPIPTLTTPTNTYCAGQTQNPIIVSGTGTFNWYSDAGLTTQIATGTTYAPNVVVTTTVYVTATNSGCQSAYQPVVITINPTPSIPTVTSSSYTYCQSQTVGTLSASGTGTILWSNSAGMNPVIHTGNTYTPGVLSIGTTVYYLTDSLNTGCKSVGTTSVSVTINQTPADPTLSAQPAAYCQGQTIAPITANGTGTILWYNNAGLNPVINSGSTYTPPGTVGTFTYYVVDSLTNGGCKSTGTVSVSVTINSTPNNPTLTTTSYTYCQSQTVSSINATGSPTILWSTSATMNPIINTGPTYTPGSLPVGTTTYYLQDSSTMGCKSSGTTTVSILINQTPSDPMVSAPGYTYCQGDPITPITATGSGTILWFDNAGLTPVINTGTTYTPTGTVGPTTYYLVDSSTAGGCKSVGTASVLVTINATPNNPNVTSPSYTYCQGQTPGIMTATGSSGGTILWSTNSSMNPIVHVGSTYTPPSSTATTTIYYIQDSSNAGCKSSSAASTVTVTVYPTPAITGVAAIDSSKCGANNGDVLGLNATGGTLNYTFQWIDQTGATVGNAADLTPIGPGTYSLIVTDANQCKDTSNTSFSVFGTSTIHAGFTPSVTQGQAPLNVVFANTSIGAANYGWSFGNNTTTSTLPNPVYTYTTNGTYTVTLLATNGSCRDSTYAVITVDIPTSIVIPNIFSPNGDGLNDEFIITCTGMKTLNCDIFNRWGQLVYTLTAPNQNWDGKLNNGNQATEGTYYFMLNAVGVDAKTYTYQGPITLVK